MTMVRAMVTTRTTAFQLLAYLSIETSGWDCAGDDNDKITTMVLTMTIMRVMVVITMKALEKPGFQ